MKAKVISSDSMRSVSFPMRGNQTMMTMMERKSEAVPGMEHSSHTESRVA